MNRTEIVLAAIGIISIVSIAGVTLAYSNTLATQQQEESILVYAYFGIPMPYGITFIAINNTDPNNPISTTKKLTWSNLLKLQNSTFQWINKQGVLSTEEGPSLNNVTYYFFGLSLLNSTGNLKSLDISVIGAQGMYIAYKTSTWKEGQINSAEPQFDYATGGGGGTATYKGTCKFCAPLNMIQQANWVKAVNTVIIIYQGY